MISIYLATVMLGLNIAYVNAKEITGEQVYLQNCLLCHGDDGSGAMPGVPDLMTSRHWMKMDEKVMLERMKKGIQTQGAAMPMPPRGGNPNLSDHEINLSFQYMKKMMKK